MTWLLMLACSAGPGDTGMPPAEPLDVAGRYNAMGVGVTGCDGVPSWEAYVEPWMAGPLEVSGTGQDLSFDFGDEMVFLGGVDASGSTSFSGDTAWSDATLVVEFLGSFSDVDGQWVLEGVLSSEVDDDEVISNNCTLDVSLEAHELVGI